MTDKGQKESIVALNSCGDIFFSSHFTVQIPKKIDDGFAQVDSYTSFAVSKDLIYLIRAGTSNSISGKAKIDLFKLEKISKVYLHASSITFESNDSEALEGSHNQPTESFTVSDIDFVGICNGFYLVHAIVTPPNKVISLLVKDREIQTFCGDINLNTCQNNQRIIRQGDLFFSITDQGRSIQKLKIRKEQI